MIPSGCAAGKEIAHSDGIGLSEVFAKARVKGEEATEKEKKRYLTV
jgi:hypothetical protein